MNILKNYYANNVATSAYFTMELIDVVIDYADIALINLFLRILPMTLNTLCKNTGIIKNMMISYMHKLIKMGGTISSDNHVLIHLPNEIIKEYVELDNLSNQTVISYMTSLDTDDFIKNKCADILRCRNNVTTDKIFLCRQLISVTYNLSNTKWFYSLISYVHQHNEFIWIILDSLRSVNKTARHYGFFPNNYVANKKISIILLLFSQIFDYDLSYLIHSNVRKYENVGLSKYFDLKNTLKKFHPNEYTLQSDQKKSEHICQNTMTNELYYQFYNMIIRNAILCDAFDYRKKVINQYAKILLDELNNDARLD